MAKKIIIIFIFISILVSCSAKEPENFAKALPNEEIIKTVEKVIFSIKNEEIEVLNLLLFSGNVEYRIGKYKSKSEVIKNIKDKKWIYNYLFDTDALCYNRSRDICDERSAKEYLMHSTNMRIIKIEVIDKNKHIIRCTMTWDEIEKLRKQSSKMITYIGVNKIDLIRVGEHYSLYSLAFQLLELDED